MKCECGADIPPVYQIEGVCEDCYAIRSEKVIHYPAYVQAWLLRKQDSMGCAQKSVRIGRMRAREPAYTNED